MSDFIVFVSLSAYSTRVTGDQRIMLCKSLWNRPLVCPYRVPVRHLAAVAGGRGWVASGGRRGWLLPGENTAEEEHQVGGAFGEPAHEIGEPVGTERNIDPYAVPFFQQGPLQIGANAIQHLELKLVGANSLLRSELFGGGDHGRIM